MVIRVKRIGQNKRQGDASYQFALPLPEPLRAPGPMDDPEPLLPPEFMGVPEPRKPPEFMGDPEPL